MFRDTEPLGLTMGSTLEIRALAKLATSASDTDELELCSNWHSPGIFTLPAGHLLHLRCLRLLVGVWTWYDP